MENLVWSEECVPDVEGGSRDENYTECCSARFEFSYSEEGLPYTPNNCSASPYVTVMTIGPMIVDMEVISDGIEADDELLVDGAVFEPGSDAGFLLGPQGIDGPALCNGRHTIDAGKVLAVVSQGDLVELGAGDNHGIDLILEGAVIVRPVASP